MENIVSATSRGETSDHDGTPGRPLRRSPVSGDGRRGKASLPRKEATVSIEILERRFAEIGARVKVERTRSRAPRIDIRNDGRGEYFELRSGGGLEVVDVRRRDRHLLLLNRDGEEKSKFLCGMDERHWFVAAIPESARGVNGVEAAKAALQPDPVRQAASRVRKKERARRRTSAYVRQGEWFFVPETDLVVDEFIVLRDEPLSRNWFGNVHVLQYAYWRGTALYAKGAVTHTEHATVFLQGWHRVLMNTEQGARAMRHVAFLD
jgi:hypothetical protein